MSTSLRNLGKFKLQECIEKVGRVETWKAVDPSFRRYVTIKIFHDDQEQQNDPNFIPRFEREARVLRTLQHSNIVSIFDVRVARSPESESITGYLLMDYIEGATLDDYIRNIAQTGKFPPSRDIVYLFKAISSAIDYAHQKGIVHGNIKPANILLNKWSLMSIGEPVLTGFGTAKLLGTCTSVLSLWGLETPLYLSPEQCQGQSGNEQSDIYALGVILYEMCTGTLPFQGDSPSDIMVQHINVAPKPPILINPDISPALSAIILHSLEKNPRMRFPNATDMAAALGEVLGPRSKGLTFPESPKTAARLPLQPPTPKTVVRLPLQHSTSYGPTISSQPAASISTRDWNPGSFPETGGIPRYAVQNQPPVTLTPLPLTPPPAQASMAGVGASMAGASPATTIRAGMAGASPAIMIPMTQPPFTPPPATAPFPSVTPFTSGGRKAANNINVLTRRVHIGIIVMLIMAFVFSILGTYLVLTRQQENAAAVSIAGHVYFISSWQGNINNSRGINDEVQVDLQNIPAPAEGKSYYAWLLGDVNQPEMPWVLLGKVSENQGNIAFLYPGDQLHTNLLANNSRFLITEENAHKTQNNPFLDLSTWRYYAVLPQNRSSTDVDHFSMLDHLRHLLVQAPELDAVGLPGGMSIWLLRNTEEILRWSVETKDRFKNVNAVRSLLTNILYYLDGKCALKDLQGVPAGMPRTLLDQTIAHIAQFALLNPCMQEQLEQASALKNAFHDTPHDYLDHVLFHLVGVLRSPGATPATRALAAQINTAINSVRAWLSQLHRDAVQLAHMTDEELAQALPVLDDMAVQASFAYAGRVDPTTGNMQGGVTWIYTGIQHLATFDVIVYRG